MHPEGGDSASLLPWPYFRHQQSSMFMMESPHPENLEYVPELVKILPCWTSSENKACPYSSEVSVIKEVWSC